MTLKGVITTPRLPQSIRLGCRAWEECGVLCDNRVMVFVDELLISKCVFYVVLFELIVKNLP